MTLMDNLKLVFEKTISVTDFVRNITKSFDDLKNGAKVLMKNNKPEAVIMSPGEYMQLINDLEDAQKPIKRNYCLMMNSGTRLKLQMIMMMR